MSVVRKVNVVVFGSSAFGPDAAFFTVECYQHHYEAGHHYTLAKNEAEEYYAFEGPFLCIDEHDPAASIVNWQPGVPLSTFNGGY